MTQVQQIAERAVLVPVGASLVARDNLVSTVNGLAGKFRTRASVERELKRVRPEFNFSPADLRRLRRPKRGRAA